MLIALDLNATMDFHSKYDLSDPKTTFKIGVLDPLTRARIEDAQTAFIMGSQQESAPKTDIKISVRQRNLDIVRYGLRGWENFKDSKGNIVPFETVVSSSGDSSRSVVSDRCLGMIPWEVIQELAEEILKANTLSKEEEKN